MSQLDRSGLRSYSTQLVWRGTWAVGAEYVVYNLAFFDKSTYICVANHTSGSTFLDDIALGYWELFAGKGDDGISGAGTGDLLATNNLSDVGNADTARGNLSAAKSGPNDDITSLERLSSVNGGALAGFRNYIINGNCQVAQRAQGALSATFKYGSVDNFQVAITSGTSISGVIGQYGLTDGVLGFGAVGSWTTGRFATQTAIESVDSAKLNGKTVTISAKVYQNTGGSRNFEILVDKPSAADNYTSSTIIATSSAQAVPHNTITSISHTFTLGALDASNGLAVTIRDTATNTVVSKTYVVGSIQLEEGSIATPIENRPYATELTLCRRYYWKTYNRGVSAGAISSQGTLFISAQATSNYLGTGATLPVEMFVTPIVTAYSPSTGTPARCSVDGVDRAVVTSNRGQSAVLFYIDNVAVNVNQFVTVHLTAEASIL